MADRHTGPDRIPTPDREARGFSFDLAVTGDGAAARLTLRAGHRPGYGAIAADWDSAELRRRIAAGRRQPIARAVGLHRWRAGDPRPRVLDATAGLGRDGFVLAALGAELTLLERQPELVALLRDAHRRAHERAGLAETADRITVIAGDALALLRDPATRRHWDFIWLDPMYPDDGKRALPAKEMQLLRDLTGGDADADALLAPARAAALRRVVVKRPAKAPWLGGVAPDAQIPGTQMRLDLYAPTPTDRQPGC